MPHRILVSAAAAGALALGACSSGPDPETLGRLAFMVGCWESAPDANGRVNKEVWTAPQGGIMFGWATVMQGGQLATFEQTRIDLRGPTATYTASPDGARPVVFTEPATRPQVDDRGRPVPMTSVTFENPAHDNPQRIAYMTAKNGLAATTSRLDGSRASSYAWERCEG